MLFDLTNLENSYLYKSIDDIYNVLDKENSEIFVDQFEGFSDSDKVINYVVRSVVEIYCYALSEDSSKNINKYVDRVSSGELFDYCKRLVEWY